MVTIPYTQSNIKAIKNIHTQLSLEYEKFTGPKRESCFNDLRVHFTIFVMFSFCFLSRDAFQEF